MKVVLDLYRPKSYQRKALKAAGLFVCDTRFWDMGCGEQLENKVVLVNYGQTVVFDTEPKWEETWTNPNGFVEKWIPNFDKYLSDNKIITDDKEFIAKVNSIIENAKEE